MFFESEDESNCVMRKLEEHIAYVLSLRNVSESKKESLDIKLYILYLIINIHSNIFSYWTSLMQRGGNCVNIHLPRWFQGPCKFCVEIRKQETNQRCKKGPKLQTRFAENKFISLVPQKILSKCHAKVINMIRCCMKQCYNNYFYT